MTPHEEARKGGRYGDSRHRGALARIRRQLKAVFAKGGRKIHAPAVAQARVHADEHPRAPGPVGLVEGAKRRLRPS